jgi:amino acid adenylation domain-containing protein
VDSPSLTLGALFDRSVAARGEAVAVEDAGRACSYRELDARARALAGELSRRGVRRGDAVVVYCERAAHAVVALLAVIKAGGAFVPVSLDTPPERLSFILSDASPRLLLLDRAGRARLAGRQERVGTIAIDEAPAPGGAEDRPAIETGPGDLAYIIYTSGTSGEPKGVMVEHGSIARRFYDWDRVFGLSASPHRCLQLAKLGFDVFTADLVKALGSGGVLVFCPDEAVLDPAQLYRVIVDAAIDFVDTVPAVLRNLTEYLEATGQDLAGVRIINCGADQWTQEEYLRGRRITKVARLFNGYGVTECAVESTLFEDDGAALAEKSTLPIGRALASDEILVVGEDLKPVAPGVPGQICIGGPCVARGYLNRPELDERAFFQRTGGGGESVRFYKTGDLGRVGADGVFEFLGRMDSQIKINGYRIELEEIERVLERLPRVRQAVVCLDGARCALTAFVRTADGKPLDPSEPAAYLARHLPPYMIPGRIVAVETLPLSQNGKVDRARLASEAALLVEGPAKRQPHDLHESGDAADLRERLRRRDIDLISVVSEFVKPSARFGLLIGGALAEGTGTELSALELLVLLDDGDAMKRRKREVAGSAVEYLSPPGPDGARIALLVDGLEISLDFRVDGRAEALSRLDSRWIVHGHDLVERWLHQRARRPEVGAQ